MDPGKKEADVKRTQSIVEISHKRLRSYAARRCGAGLVSGGQALVCPDTALFFRGSVYVVLSSWEERCVNEG